MMINLEKTMKYHDDDDDDDDEYWMKMQNYIHSLEQERHKILAFKRELPLSLQLITQTIDSYKHQQLHHLDEFIPIKVSSSSSFSSSPSSSFHHDHDHDHDHEDDDQECYQTTCNSKLDWLKSAHLSLGNNIDIHQTPDLPPTLKQLPLEIQVNNSINGAAAAFNPFVKNKLMPAAINNIKTKPTSNPNNDDNNHNHNQKDDRRKSRRCWSPDLHTRFVHALQNLGGPHVATPKQIREVMKVDGLTNDEVKSHLQKYRLHTRRPIQPTYNHIDNNAAQQPQFAIVGGIWVPKTISDSEKTMPSTTDGIYSSFKLSSQDCRSGDRYSFSPNNNSSPKNAQPATTLLLG